MNQNFLTQNNTLVGLTLPSDDVNKQLTGVSHFMESFFGNTGIGKKEYHQIHFWIRNELGKASFCNLCDGATAKRFEWALKKGCKYEKNVNNFFALCTSCHRKYDMTDSIRDKMSKSAKESGTGTWMTGKKLSEETKEKISKSKLGKPIGIGKILSEAHKKAISDGLNKHHFNKNKNKTL